MKQTVEEKLKILADAASTMSLAHLVGTTGKTQVVDLKCSGMWYLSQLYGRWSLHQLIEGFNDQPLHLRLCLLHQPQE